MVHPFSHSSSGLLWIRSLFHEAGIHLGWDASPSHGTYICVRSHHPLGQFIVANPLTGIFLGGERKWEWLLSFFHPVLSHLVLSLTSLLSFAFRSSLTLSPFPHLSSPLKIMIHVFFFPLCLTTYSVMVQCILTFFVSFVVSFFLSLSFTFFCFPPSLLHSFTISSPLLRKCFSYSMSSFKFN